MEINQKIIPAVSILLVRKKHDAHTICSRHLFVDVHYDNTNRFDHLPIILKNRRNSRRYSERVSKVVATSRRQGCAQGQTAFSKSRKNIKETWVDSDRSYAIRTVITVNREKTAYFSSPRSPSRGEGYPQQVWRVITALLEGTRSVSKKYLRFVSRDSR